VTEMSMVAGRNDSFFETTSFAVFEFLFQDQISGGRKLMLEMDF